MSVTRKFDPDLERSLVEEESSVSEHSEGGELPDFEAAAGILDVLGGDERDAEVVQLVVDVLQLVQHLLALLKVVNVKFPSRVSVIM